MKGATLGGYISSRPWLYVTKRYKFSPEALLLHAQEVTQKDEPESQVFFDGALLYDMTAAGMVVVSASLSNSAMVSDGNDGAYTRGPRTRTGPGQERRRGNAKGKTRLGRYGLAFLPHVIVFWRFSLSIPALRNVAEMWFHLYYAPA